MYIFVVSHNCMIPGAKHCEVCYKTQRLAALPWQLQGGGKGTMVRACPGLSVHPSGVPHAGGAGRVVHAVMGNPAFPCESILTASGERAGAASIDVPQVGMWEGISFPRTGVFSIS